MSVSENAEQAVSLYLHFPFCVRKCRYCDFLSGPADKAERKRYVRALETELWKTAEAVEENGSSEKLPVDTVFLGGGTPSLLSGEELWEVLQAVRTWYDVRPDAEITMECNPGTAGLEALCAYREAGVNRLSIGVQSFRDEELRLLGRIHSSRQARECFYQAREAGFTNISLDLMSALPGQTMDAWLYSLSEAAALGPEHISAYSLILEEGTELYRMAKQGVLPPLPEEALDRDMYHRTKAFLEGDGYHRYEVSNYAREGFESRHNSGYWTGHPYLGFGTGAASYWRGMRWSHTRQLAAYCERMEQVGSCEELLTMPWQDRADEALYEDTEQLSPEDQMEEFMFLGLRRMEGVSEEEFHIRFGVSMESVYGAVLRRYQELELLQKERGRVSLTDAGVDVCNTVMADFLL